MLAAYSHSDMIGAFYISSDDYRDEPMPIYFMKEASSVRYVNFSRTSLRESPY